MKKPNVILLVGHPLVGKSTWLKNNYTNAKIISRDDIVLEVYGSDDYNTAFGFVDQKEVDKILNKRLLEAALLSDDIIIDMTNMMSKSRMKKIRKFPNHNKLAVIFPHLDEDEIIKRNQYRLLTDKKSIPISVVKNMIDTYQEPTKDEGFDEIIFVK